MSRPARSNTVHVRAFTMVEVILVLALVVTLLGGIVGLSERVLEHRLRSRAWSRSQEVAEQFIGTLDRELSTCVISDPGAGAGVKGDSTSIRIVSRGVGGGGPGGGSDLIVSELRFDPRTGEVSGRRSGPAGLETEYDAIPEGEAASSGSPPAGVSEPARGGMTLIGGGLEAVRILYRDRDAWAGQFDSLSGPRLPLAVQVEIWFGKPPVAAGATAIADTGSAPADSSSAGESGSPRVPAESAGAGAGNFPRRAPDRVRVIAIPDASDDPASSPPAAEGAA